MFTLHLERVSLELLNLSKAAGIVGFYFIVGFVVAVANPVQSLPVHDDCVSGSKSQDVVITQLLSTQ